MHGVNTAVGFADQPEAVAADRIHMGVDDGQCCRHGNGGLGRVATSLQDIEPGLRRQMMRRRHHAAIGLGRMDHAATPSTPLSSSDCSSSNRILSRPGATINCTPKGKPDFIKGADTTTGKAKPIACA